MSPNPSNISSPNSQTENSTNSTTTTTTRDSTKIVQLPLSNRHRITSNITKYPSNRNTHLQNAVEWLSARKFDDNVNPYWRIHNKLYDLESFIIKHPGGSDWISMTKGTDITEAFEASHILNYNQIVENILPKYFIKDAEFPRINNLYTFEPNGFYSILKSRIEPILKNIGTGPTKTLIRIQDLLGILFICLALFSIWFNLIIVQILTGFILGMTIICGHNFFHIKDNWRKYYFDLSCLSSFEWRISHALSHHLFTNTILDFEIYMLEPFLEVCPGIKRNWMQKYGIHVLLYFSYFFNFGLELGKRLKNIFWTKVQKLRPENLIIFIQLIVFILIAPNAMIGLRSWIIIHSCASFYFGFVGLMAAHHHPISFHEGDEMRPAPDFGLCQLDATKGRSEEFARTNILFIVTTFGQHPLHHLFPTVCHSKLGYLQSVLDKTLAEFQEKFPSLSKGEYFAGIHLQLMREEPNVFRNKNNS